MINRKIFFDKIRQSLFKGSLSQSQVDGMNYMLDVFENDYNWSDLRWISYAFATAYHETAFTMQPIKEYGGESYLQSKPYYPYYGRGYVQLTWEENYRKMGDKLGVNMLGANKDKALEPSIAAEVMYVGMRDGDFTGKKLSTYFSSSVNDPVNARRIINGTDKAQTIAGYHDKFLSAFNEAHTSEENTNTVDESIWIKREEVAQKLEALAKEIRG
jgi:putative chitinase